MEEIAARYEKLIEYMKDQTGGLDVTATPDGHVAVGWLTIGNAYFSDTLLFWTRYNQVSLPTFTRLVSEAIATALRTDWPCAAR